MRRPVAASRFGDADRHVTAAGDDDVILPSHLKAALQRVLPLRHHPAGEEREQHRHERRAHQHQHHPDQLRAVGCAVQRDVAVADGHDRRPDEVQRVQHAQPQRLREEHRRGRDDPDQRQRRAQQHAIRPQPPGRPQPPAPPHGARRHLRADGRLAQRAQRLPRQHGRRDAGQAQDHRAPQRRAHVRGQLGIEESNHQRQPGPQAPRRQRHVDVPGVVVGRDHQSGGVLQRGRRQRVGLLGQPPDGGAARAQLLLDRGRQPVRARDQDPRRAHDPCVFTRSNGRAS